MKTESLEAALGPGRLIHGEPLSRHTSFKIGGPAELFARPSNVGDLKACLDWAKANACPVFFLAGGTNLLIRDGGIRGLTLKLDGDFKEINIRGNEVRAGAAANLALLARKVGLAGLSGLEFAVGIPGSLGGGLVMNAGAHGGELSQVVRRIGLIETGEIKEILASEAGFAYRESRFKRTSVLLLWAELELSLGDSEVIAARMEEVLNKRKASQPLSLPNAGCVFKNPPGQAAGRLIEEAGYKGLRRGGAQVSEVHANFVVNLGGAKASDVLGIMEELRQGIKAKYGLELENEVLVVGDEA